MRQSRRRQLGLTLRECNRAGFGARHLTTVEVAFTLGIRSGTARPYLDHAHARLGVHLRHHSRVGVEGKLPPLVKTSGLP
jgi:DNA-binding CsgD family transcriptional regulator